MSMKKEEAVRLVIEAGQRLQEAGLVARTWGNISARISDTQFVITPSGVSYDRLTPELIVTVNIADCSHEGKVKPSSEKGIHADCYRLRPDVNFVVHTHQLYATAWGVTGKALRLRGSVLGETVPNAAYGISSTKKLRQNVAAAVEEYPRAKAVFMRSHGALFLGADCEECFEIAAALEDYCRAKVEDALDLSGERIGVDSLAMLKILLPDTEVRFVDTPAILAASRSKKTHYPVIDDMAQIAGASLETVTVKDGWEKKAVRALRHRNLVFLRDRGAVIIGAKADECDALAAVAEKNCLSELYAKAVGVDVRLGYADAQLQRTVYLTKYSKLK